MKIKIKQYEYKKVEVASKEVQLPTETSYYFQRGIRRSIAITPVFTTWNKEQFGKEEEMYALDVVCLYNSFKCMSESFSLQIRSLEEIYYLENHEYHDFVVDFLDNEFEPRTKEQFDGDFESYLLKLKRSF